MFCRVHSAIVCFFPVRTVAEGKAIINDALEQVENPSHVEVKCTAGESDHERLALGQVFRGGREFSLHLTSPIF